MSSIPGDFSVSKLSNRDRTPDSVMEKLVRDGAEFWDSLILVLLLVSNVNTDLKYWLKQSTEADGSLIMPPSTDGLETDFVLFDDKRYLHNLKGNSTQKLNL